jgi:cytoskeletal protein CcmA (bactofilin family)
MFKDKKIAMPSQSDAQTIIAQGVKVEGDFKADGDVIIDGDVVGSVSTEKFLQIGESAKIKADVKANSAVIAGEVNGNITVGDMLELLATSNVKGDITTKRISIAEGAIVNGKLAMDGSQEVE